MHGKYQDMILQLDTKNNNIIEQPCMDIGWSGGLQESNQKNKTHMVVVVG